MSQIDFGKGYWWGFFTIPAAVILIYLLSDDESIMHRHHCLTEHGTDLYTISQDQLFCNVDGKYILQETYNVTD